MIRIITLLLGIVLPLGLFAQQNSESTFRQLCERMQIEILLPTERTYQAVRPQKNEVQPYQYALYSRKEKMEIRYFLHPDQPDDPMLGMPHVHLGRLMMNLASNEEDAHIAVHEISPESLASDYQADWGQVCFFPPKRSFSGDFEQCQMLALYREGVGMAYVFFLFTDAPETLAARKLALYFSAVDK